MVIEEALWLRAVLAKLELGPSSVALDIGSSTEYFRRMHQPHIDYYVFLPLRRRGVKVVHVDARTDEGVDVVCDLADPANESVVATMPRADVIVCSNLLEHVLDRELVVRRLVSLLNERGSLIVTVPHVYRYHADPIDTGYRPTNAELEELIRSSEPNLVTFESTVLDVDCRYRNVPEGLLPRLAFRAKNLVKHRLLAQEVIFDRCQVAAVAARRRVERPRRS